MFGRKKTGQGEEPLPTEGPRVAASPRASRPDASAVLDRQPVPPVRRPSEHGGPGGQPVRRTNVGRPVETSATNAAAPRESAMAKNESEGEGKKLIVGRGIRLSGEIQACERLVVEGEVHADLTGALVLEIAENGLFKGRATVDYAEISGSFEGELTVRDRLMLRTTGQVNGDLRYAEMEIERGGRVRGTIGELNGQPAKGKDASAQAAMPPSVGSSSPSSSRFTSARAASCRCSSARSPTMRCPSADHACAGAATSAATSTHQHLHPRILIPCP